MGKSGSVGGACTHLFTYSNCEILASTAQERPGEPSGMVSTEPKDRSWVLGPYTRVKKPGFESSSSGKLQVLGPDRDSSSGRIGGVFSHGRRDGGALRKPHWQADDR